VIASVSTRANKQDLAQFVNRRHPFTNISMNYYAVKVVHFDRAL